MREQEQRKRRKVRRVLFAALALLVLGGFGFTLWDLYRAREQARIEGERDTEQRLKADQARRGIAANQQLATGLRKVYKFKEAEQTLRDAAEFARQGAPELLPEVEQDLADLAFVIALDNIRFRKWVWDLKKRDFNTKIASPEYRKAFSARGLDLASLAPTDAATRVAASAVRAELLAALDDWALYEPDKTLQLRLLEVARRADPGSWATRLRDPAARTNQAALKKLADEVDLSHAPPAALVVLAELMEQQRLDPSRLLTAGRVAHPSEFELAFALGQWHTLNATGQQIGSYEAARALRPENATVWINLGAAQQAQGDTDGAIATFQKAIELEPNDASTHFNLGNAHYDKKNTDQAIAAYERAIELNQNHASAHNNLGNALRLKKERDKAIAAYRKVIKLEPEDSQAHNNLGATLADKGELDEAIASYIKAIELDGMNALAHNNLGNALRLKKDMAGATAAWTKAVIIEPKLMQARHNLAQAHFERGTALHGKKDLDGATSAYEMAIEYNPQHATAYYNLGFVRQAKKNLDGAITAWTKAADLDSKLTQARFSAAVALEEKEDLKGAIAAYEKVIEADPKDGKPHVNLSDIYRRQKQYTKAIASARSATEADPTLPSGYAILGVLLQETGDIPGARAALTEATRLDRRWAALLAKLPPLEPAPPPREK